MAPRGRPKPTTSMFSKTHTHAGAVGLSDRPRNLGGDEIDEYFGRVQREISPLSAMLAGSSTEITET
jgi:hypothetical protein